MSHLADSAARCPQGTYHLRPFRYLKPMRTPPVSAACSRDAFGDPADFRWKSRGFADPPHDGGAFVGDGAYWVGAALPAVCRLTAAVA